MAGQQRYILKRWFISGGRYRSDRPTRRLVSSLVLTGIGFWLALTMTGLGSPPLWAAASRRLPIPSSDPVTVDPSPAPNLSGQVLFEQGQHAFDAGKIEMALDLWQQAAASDLAIAHPLFQGMVLNAVAIAHQHLGQWSEAQLAIDTGLQRIEPEENARTIGNIRAQLLNTRGRGEWFLGQLDRALATWEQAADAYRAAGDREGLLGSQINQVQAMETLGYYRQACHRILTALAIAQSCDSLAQPTDLSAFPDLLDAPRLSTVNPAVTQGSPLDQVLRQIDHQPNGLLKVLGLRSLGNLLRLTGHLDLAQQVLHHGLAIAQGLDPQQQGLTQLSLADTQRDQYFRAKQLYDRTKLLGDRDLASQLAAQTLASYDHVLGFDHSLDDFTRLQAQLQRLRVLVDLETWNQLATAVPEIQAIFPPNPEANRAWPTMTPQVTAIVTSLRTHTGPSRVGVEAYVNFAQQLLQLQPLQPHQDWLSLAEEMATMGVRQADQLGDRRSQSYAYGMLGQVYEAQGNQHQSATPSPHSPQAHERWTAAQTLTRNALGLAQAAQIPEITYRWQWQLGRLADNQQDEIGAIAYYEAAVKTLDVVRNNLLGIDAEVQFSFRDDVEPIYRRLVELLLTQGDQPPSQATLQQAIQDIDALQLSELENFLGCNLADSVALSETLVDPTAAIIYPIILSQQLAVITKLPQTNDLHLHTIDIDAASLNTKLLVFRRELLRPYRSQGGLRLSQELYNWLIRPIQPLLATENIKTLVFVLDGKLRNVPMATLHDGEDYLVKQYALALMPGLQLIKPQPLSPASLDALTFGLSQVRPEFPPHNGFSDLVNVEVEVNEIKNQLPSRTFLNQDFTEATLAERIRAIASPIVHLATHGQFSSDPEDTFILAWDRRIDVNTLSAILQSRNTKTHPIELLVLSACKTAEGDDRATLGLAGIAVRSGARSTLASLWTVDDQATADMMNQFYKELAHSSMAIAKAEALQRAQVHLLDSDTYNAPRYWAPFILVGNWL